MKNISTGIYALFLAVLASGCGGGKQFRPPIAPSAEQQEKVFENDDFIVSQGSITSQDIEDAFNAAPPHVAGTAIKVTNKKAKSCILEIERTNLGTYDSEDLSIELSKHALKHPEIKRATSGFDILQGATIGWTSIVGGITWYNIYKSIHKVNGSLSPTAERFAKVGLSFLGIVPIILIGSLYYSYLSKEKEEIQEALQESIIDMYKKVLDSAALSFDDMVEVPGHGSLEQVIFYNEKPVDHEHGGIHKELVLKLASDGKEILVPLQA